MTDFKSAAHPSCPEHVVETFCIGETWSFRVVDTWGNRITGGGGFNNADDARRKAVQVVDMVLRSPGWGF
jgi:hypothetical protein